MRTSYSIGGFWGPNPQTAARRAQALWWDGLGKLAEALGGAEAGELLGIMAEKGVRCRTDVYEIQLAAAADAAGLLTGPP